MTPDGPPCTIERALARWPSGPLLAAVSGGPDSSALLHALAGSPGARARGLRAIHIDHQLHPHSEDWAAACARLCAALDVELAVVRVEVAPSPTGLEAAARDARYAAIAANLRGQEIVVTAHHADDQAETLLLRLLRGAGPRGLGAMRPLRRLGNGWLARPWLELTRAQIADYASAHGLTAIDDPANRDPRFDRSHLRARVLPALAARWPHAPVALARSAALLRDLGDWLDVAAAQALARCRTPDPAVLDARALRALPCAARAEVLRAWFADLALPPPDHRALAEIETSLLDARADATPRIAWRGAELRAWRGQWHALAPLHAAPAGVAAWDGRAPLVLAGAAGRLELGAPAALALAVAWRRGGERIRLAATAPRRPLKHVLQELGVPPWRRARAPLLWHRDELWAAGDWVASHALRDYERAHGVRLRWVRPD